MKKKRLLLVAVLGVALMTMPGGWITGLFPPNALCVNCKRELRVSTGRILCGGCRHIMSAQQAKELFTWPSDVPRLNYSVKLDGPIPPNVTVVNP